MDIDDILQTEFEPLRRSALTKLIAIAPFLTEGVTLGPNAAKQQKSIRRESIEKTPGQSPKSPAQLTPKKSACIVRIPHTSPAARILHSLEQTRREDEHAAMEKHRQVLADFNKEQAARRAAQWKELQLRHLREAQEQENQIIRMMEQVKLECAAEAERDAARNRQREKETAEMLLKKAEEEKRLASLYAGVQKYEHEIFTLLREVDKVLRNNQEAKEAIAIHEQTFRQMRHKLSEIGMKSKEKKLAADDLQLASTLYQSVKKLKVDVGECIKKHYTEREQEAAAQVAVLRKNSSTEIDGKVETAPVTEASTTLPQPVAQPVATAPNTTAAAPTNTAAEQPEDSNARDQREMFQMYLDLRQKLELHRQSYIELENDASLKQFRFDCKKAINIPVNAISLVTRTHLVDKYEKLRRLLRGETVQIGDARICASRHPQGVAFCMDLLASKFVLQGDLTISSNPEAAFPYAAIIVALWNEFPAFGDLFLAHLYEQCPYLVPLRIVRAGSSLSDEEYYRFLGYQFKDGVVEPQDKFLKRMSGIGRLYFTICITEPKSVHAQNPHWLANAWRWIARTLNMLPMVDVTATLVYCFIEVAGSMMIKTYAQQFVKILRYIAVHQLPLMRRQDSGGPVARLELLLDDYMKTHNLKPPSGALPNGFW